jgi:hypothetical protein
MGLYDNLSEKNTKILADELGLHIVDLDRLKFEVLYEFDNEDEHIGYIFRLLGDNPQEILDLIPLVNNEIRLSSTLFPEEYADWYDYQFDSIDEGSDHLQIFNDEMTSLLKLNKIQLESRQMQLILKRQIYIGVVSSMETYLSDKFISTVSSNEDYLKRFVETHPEFLKRKFEMKDVFQAYDNIRDTAKVVMLDVIYHDMVKVRKMYLDTFLVDFPTIKEVLKCVVTRHDLVHRNGKT